MSDTFPISRVQLVYHITDAKYVTTYNECILFYLFNIYTGLPAQAKPVLPQGPVDIHSDIIQM